jgi:hypothetical protein
VIRKVNVTRYVTPLREGGSLPAIVEADDDGLYVLKFRAAGQGVKALIAELISGEIARALGLRVPDIVFAELDPILSRTEPDPEIQELMAASAGMNLALDYLPGSITFDPLVFPVDEQLASEIVWLDCLVTNVDRTPRNTNMLVWHKELWLIDHGASLFFHHGWTNIDEQSRRPFLQVKEHVLLPLAGKLDTVDREFREKLTSDVLSSMISAIPNDWLVSSDETPEEMRGKYQQYFEQRLAASEIFLEEAQRARKAFV